MPGFSKAEEEDFEAERDLETIIRADKIKKDGKRLNRAKKMAKKQMDALKSVEK